MKLLELPMGQRHELNDIEASHLLRKWPDRYIRAELPEYWRVEGYDNSWEYAQVFCNPDSKNWVGYHHAIGLDVYDNGHPVTRGMEIISRAEFEYHIYNPWERDQTKTEVTEHFIKATEQLDLETLKLQAEKMGYGLVKKEVEQNNTTSSDLRITGSEPNKFTHKITPSFGKLKAQILSVYTLGGRFLETEVAYKEFGGTFRDLKTSDYEAAYEWCKWMLSELDKANKPITQ